jgi:hypothetical protein
MAQQKMMKDMSKEEFMAEIEAIVDSRDKSRRKSHQGSCFSDQKVLVVGADARFYPDADYTAWGR